jgi:hypothetical protein
VSDGVTRTMPIAVGGHIVQLGDVIADLAHTSTLPPGTSSATALYAEITAKQAALVSRHHP